MAPRVRTLRTRISGVLLLAGTVAFWVSLALPAVVKVHWTQTVALEGWSCAVNYEPTFATNGFLALAFAVWAAAVWLRSRWAWTIGVVLSVGGALFHPLIGAWPGFEGIQRVHRGYWLWDGATAAVCAAFLVLPFPIERAAEPLARDDVHRFRKRLAAMLGAGATVLLLGFHLLLPTTTSGEWREGPPQPDDSLGWYSVGGAHSSMDPRTRTRSRVTPDGRAEDVAFRWVDVRCTVVEAQFADARTAPVETALLLAPALFLAAATTRRRGWRWGGALVTAAVTAIAPFLDCPWPTSGLTPHPLVVLWVALPALFLAAFLLLPSEGRRTEGAPLRPPPGGGAPTA